MTIWKVTCVEIWDKDADDKETCTHSFGSYEGAVIWAVENAEWLEWVSIEENSYVPSSPKDEGGKLMITIGTQQFFKQDELEVMKKVYNKLCK